MCGLGNINLEMARVARATTTGNICDSCSATGRYGNAGLLADIFGNLASVELQSYKHFGNSPTKLSLLAFSHF